MDTEVFQLCTVALRAREGTVTTLRMMNTRYSQVALRAREGTVTLSLSSIIASITKLHYAPARGR